MKEKKYNLIKALSWYTISSFLIKSINFFTLRLFTSLINTTAFGIFGVYQSYLSIFEMVILVGTAHSIKMVKYDDKIDYGSYVSSVIYIPIIGTGILLFLSQCIFLFTDKVAGLNNGMWSALFVTAGVAAVSNIIYSKLILEGNYKIFISASFINTVLNIGISVVLCYKVFSAANAYWSRIIGELIAGIGNFLFLLFFERLRKPNKEYIIKGILFGFPLLIHSIATQILIQSDKIIISRITSYAAVGIYTAATNIVTIPTTLLSSIEHSWSPWYYESLSKKDYKSIKKKNMIIVSLFAIGIMCFVLVSPEIVKIMTSNEYWDSVYVLIPLSIATFAELIYIIPLNTELYYKKNNVIWVYTVFVVVFNIVIDIICIKAMGYLASAYVTCISRFVLFAMHYIRAKKIDGNDTMDMGIILLLTASLVVANIVVVIFIENLLLRCGMVIFILLFGGICLAKNKEVIRRGRQ